MGKVKKLFTSRWYFPDRLLCYGTAIQRELANLPVGIPKTFYEGRLRPEVRPLTLLYNFLTEQVPLSYTFYWHPCLELCNPFNCWKCTVFKIWINHKTRTFSRLFLSHKRHLLALLNLFTDRNDRFPYPFICFNNWNPDPFIYLKPEQGTPFERSLPV